MLATYDQIVDEINRLGGLESIPKRESVGPWQVAQLDTSTPNLDDIMGTMRSTLKASLSMSEGQIKIYLIDRVLFGFYKASNHRGISVSTAVEYVKTLLWVLNDMEGYDFANSDDNYACYGVPILKYTARRYAIPIPTDIENWVDGEPCNLYCDEGCIDNDDKQSVIYEDDK